MTRFLLIRHGMTDAVDTTLAGRASGWSLNEPGRGQVRRLADALADTPIHQVCTSPLERAMETAAEIAARRRLTPRVREALNEVDYGAWTGRTFSELSAVADWQRFNRHRGIVRIPGGELLCEVQARIAAELAALSGTCRGRTLALVSHGDVIKSALAHCLGAPLDLLMRFEVHPASVSVIDLSAEGASVVAFNIPPEAVGVSLRAFPSLPAAL